MISWTTIGATLTIHGVSLALLAAPAALPAAAPAAATAASQPTSQPAKPLPTERVVENDKLRFRYAVPKTWKQVPQQGEATVFQLPAAGDARRTNPSLIVTAGDVKDRTLADEVAGRRAAIQQRNPEAKFAEDAATSIAGHDGWTFIYETSLKQTVTSNGKSHDERLIVKVRDQLTLVDGRAIEFVLMSDDKGLLIRSKLVDRVMNTLVIEP